MGFDNDKIDEFTLALLFLVTHERHEGGSASSAAIRRDLTEQS